MLSNHLQLAVRAAIEASKEILSVYRSNNFEVEIKEDNSPLTKADKAAHKIITSFLKKSDIPILSEEGKSIPYSTRKNWSHLWIVDPIDGTKEFIKRNGEFTVNIALIKNNIPIIGVILAPVSAELYFSETNLGAFKSTINLNNCNLEHLLKKAQKLPLITNDKIYTVVASRSHLSKETETFVQELRKKYGDIKFSSTGSSLKLCMVAEGKANCYPRFAPTMEWDTAAGQAICEAAGFQVIDYISKKPMRYNRKKLLNNWFTVF